MTDQDSSIQNPLIALSLITRVFAELGIMYVVVGSFASSTRGMYRTTTDVDILAELHLGQITPLIRALEKDFYIDEIAVERAVSRRSSFNAIHLGTIFKVDVFVPEITGFTRQQLERRLPLPLGPNYKQEIFIATAEDTILAKLDWYRKTGNNSTTQWSDVAGLIGANCANLDLAYLHEWANKLGLNELLEEALNQA